MFLDGHQIFEDNISREEFLIGNEKAFLITKISLS